MSNYIRSKYNSHVSWTKQIKNALNRNEIVYVYGEEQYNIITSIANEMGYKIEDSALHTTQYETKYWSIRRLK